MPVLFFLQLHGFIVARCLDITLGSAALTVACFCYGKLHGTILALTDQYITFFDFHTLTSIKSAYGNTIKKTYHRRGSTEDLEEHGK